MPIAAPPMPMRHASRAQGRRFAVIGLSSFVIAAGGDETGAISTVGRIGSALAVRMAFDTGGELCHQRAVGVPRWPVFWRWTQKQGALSDREGMTTNFAGPGSPERFGYSWDHYAAILPEHEEQFLRWTAPLTKGTGRASISSMVAAASAAIPIGRCAMARRGAGDGCRRSHPGAGAGQSGGLSRRGSARPKPLRNPRAMAALTSLSASAWSITWNFPKKQWRECWRGQAWRDGADLALRPREQWLDRAFCRPAAYRVIQPVAARAGTRPVLAADSGAYVFLRLGLTRITYFKLLRGFSFAHLRAIVFDHMIPKIARYYRKDEAIALLKSAGLENVEAVWVNEMSWAVHGKRPV